VHTLAGHFRWDQCRGGTRGWSAGSSASDHTTLNVWTWRPSVRSQPSFHCGLKKGIRKMLNRSEIATGLCLASPSSGLWRS
jgi:hypothetical protein